MHHQFEMIDHCFHIDRNPGDIWSYDLGHIDIGGRIYWELAQLG